MTPPRILSVVLALAALLAPALVASAQDEGTRFGLRVEPDRVEVEAGQVAVVDVTVTNRAPRPLLARLDVAEAWQENGSLRLRADVAPASALLEPGASRIFRVEVRTENASIGQRWFRVNATSPDDALAANATTFSVWVAPSTVGPTFMTPQPPWSPPFQQAPTPRGPWEPTGVRAFNASLLTPELTLRWPYGFDGVQVRVENAGDRATLVSRVEDPEGRLGLDENASGGRMDLFPGMEVTLTVGLRAQEPEPGTHRVLVRLHLEEDPAQERTFEVVVHVEERRMPQMPDFGMMRDVRILGPDEPVRIAPGGKAEVGFVLANEGNRTVRVTLEGAAVHRNESAEVSPEASAGWNASWDRIEATLGPNETLPVTLTLRAPPNATPGERHVATRWVLLDDGSFKAGVPGTLDVLVVDADDPTLQASASGEDASQGAGGAAAILAHPAALAGVGVGAGALVAARALRRESWRYGLLAALAPLYTRLRKGDVLEHEARDDLHRLVVANPGIHYSALKQRTGLNTGALVHHLRALERNGYLASRREGTLRRFYAVGHAPVPPPPAIPTTPVQQRVLALLDERPMTQRELAERLGLTQQGVSYHVKTLERKGLLVIRERDGIHRCHRVHPFTALER